MSSYEVGFIGAGNMTAAIIKGMLLADPSMKDKIIVSSPSSGLKVSSLPVKRTQYNLSVCRSSKYVFLACKPHQAAAVLTSLHLGKSSSIFERDDQVLISICGGVLLAQYPTSSPIVRIMPNIPVAVGAGAFPYCLSANCSPQMEEGVINLLKPLGLVVKVDESYFNSAQGICGNGPAYMAMIAESLADAGVKGGLSRDVAQKLAAVTLYGSGKYLLDTGINPADLKNSVCSPGGSTIAGVASLESSGLRSALIQAHEATLKKTLEQTAAASKGDFPVSTIPDSTISHSTIW